MYWTGGWGDWLLMSAMMVVFWGVVIWAILYFVRERDDRRPHDRPSDKSAAEILYERFARGEIDKKEFQERRDALSSDRR